MLTCPGPAQLGGKAGALEAGLPGPTRGPTPLSPFFFFVGRIPTKQAGILIYQAVRGTHPRFPFITPGLLQTTQNPHRAALPTRHWEPFPFL